MDRNRVAVCTALCAAFAASPALGQNAPRPTPDKPAPAPDKAAPAPAKAAPAAPKAEAAPADLEKAKVHFGKGKELFDKKEFAAAVEEFKESYRLSKNPLLLYNIGFTLDQLGQRSLALFYYQKFVAAVPGDNPNVAPSRERIEVLQKEIEDASLSGAPPAAAGAATAGKAGPGPDEGRAVTKFEHAVVDAAPPGKPIDLGAFVPAGNYQVSLFFRAAGEAKFASVDMKPRYNERVGRIPADKTRAPTVQYYIEVRDENGQLVERSGKATSPNLIFVEKDAKPHYYADLGDDKSYHEDTSVDSSSYSGGGRIEEGGSSGDGWLDAGSTKFGYLKWGSTGTAAGLLALSATFYFIAADAASGLEGEASSSLTGDCPGGPPCRKFSGNQQDLEGRGQRFETMANVALGVGAVSAVAAGVFWYLDVKDRRARASGVAGTGGADSSVVATPVLGPDFVGGAAAVRF